jgi:uncharacterized protein YcaQ
MLHAIDVLILALRDLTSSISKNLLLYRVNKISLTQSQARAIILHAAGLAKRAQFGKGVDAVYKLIDHLGFLQIDTNYVVERAHHHAIFARVPDYKLEWLEQLQTEGRIFEFWTYATGYIPTDDFRFSLPVKASFLARRKSLTPAEAHLMRQILDRIGREGPVMARDFEYDRVTKSAGWWDWRPSKVALERLHFEGKLMTLRKPNFEKVYDLQDNVLPSSIDTTLPTDEEYARHVILRSLKALGVGSFKDIHYRARYVKVKNTLRQELTKMMEAGDVCLAQVAGIKEELYLLPEYKTKKIKLTGEVFILSPFDGLNVFRHRLKIFFDFDYMVECFVPKPKRKYGYFALPILVGDRFVARMDSKADRKQKVLIIFNLHFEPIKLSQSEVSKLGAALMAFAKFNQCQEVVVEKSNNKKLLKEIREAVS